MSYVLSNIDIMKHVFICVTACNIERNVDTLNAVIPVTLHLSLLCTEDNSPSLPASLKQTQPNAVLVGPIQFRCGSKILYSCFARNYSTCRNVPSKFIRAL